MADTPVLFPTVGEIARQLGKTVHRIEYVIRSRNIRPTGMAGNARVFTEEAVRRIASEIRRIDEGRGDHDAIG